MDRRIVQHYRTSGATPPSVSNLADGEIAISMNPDTPVLWIKDANGTIREFVDKQYIELLLNYKANNNEVYTKSEVDSILDYIRANTGTLFMDASTLDENIIM